MGHPSVQERLKIIAEIIPAHEDIRGSLVLLQQVLQVQQRIDDTSNKGAKQDWMAQQSIISLEQQALAAKKPMIQFLTPVLFDGDALQAAFRAIVHVFLLTYPERKGLQKLLNQLDRGAVDFMSWITAVFAEDGEAIVRWAEKYELASSLFYMLITAPLQPFMEELARQASSSFYDKWWQARCPICGQTPRVARLRDRRRFLTCTYCGAEYRSDLFLCVNCDNKDPYTLQYMQFDGTPAFQIDFCTRCRNYLKVINDQALPEPIPGFLADLLTLELDVHAKHVDLVRHGTD
jgi:formate dehydrogenase maturation protein FdhE